MVSIEQMSCDNSNFDLHGKKMGLELYPATAWFIIIILSAIFGDTIILIASIKYKAFRLHDAIVVFIQHIAVCDLLMAITCIFPQIVSLIANCWILGTAICYINAYGPRLAFPVGLYLICTMTITKLILLKYPLKARHLSGKQAHMMCAGIWVFACYYPGTLLLVDKDDIHFDFKIYTCVYAYSDEKKWKLLKALVLGLLSIVPTIIIVCISFLLVKYMLKARRVSRRCDGSFRWKGVGTVLLTATTFILSSAPLTIYNLVPKGTEENNVHFYRIAYSFMYFSVSANCFIYYFTVPSFREFLKKKIRHALSHNKIHGKTF